MPHVLERFVLRPTVSGTAIEYRGELGTDLWALGAAWGAIVAPSWQQTVASALEAIADLAERLAARRSKS